MTELEKLLKKISENERDNDLDKAFEEVAIELIQNSIFVAGHIEYLIKEIEFYFWNTICNHNDPYVHKKERQLEFGEWYFHHAIAKFKETDKHKGIDITFGNKDKCIYGGILIRGIERIESEEMQINGPSNIVNEIFGPNGNGKETFSIIEFSLEKSVFDTTSPLHIKGNESSSASLLNVKRKLSKEPKREDSDGLYYNKKYRFYGANWKPKS